jgi:HK97 gp10 family phage protein
MAQSRPLTPLEARKALRALPGFAKAGAVQVMNDTVGIITELARNKAPVVTGRLKEAIDLRLAKGSSKRPAAASGVRVGGRRGTTIGAPGTFDGRSLGVSRGEVFEDDIQDAYYWKFVEYGTNRSRSRPMFRPAALFAEPRHRAEMQRALAEAADKMVRSA